MKIVKEDPLSWMYTGRLTAAFRVRSRAVFEQTCSRLLRPAVNRSSIGLHLHQHVNRERAPMLTRRFGEAAERRLGTQDVFRRHGLELG